MCKFWCTRNRYSRKRWNGLSTVWTGPKKYSLPNADANTGDIVETSIRRIHRFFQRLVAFDDCRVDSVPHWYFGATKSNYSEERLRLSIVQITVSMPLVVCNRSMERFIYPSDSCLNSFDIQMNRIKITGKSTGIDKNQNKKHSFRSAAMTTFCNTFVVLVVRNDEICLPATSSTANANSTSTPLQVILKNAKKCTWSQKNPTRLLSSLYGVRKHLSVGYNIHE